MKPFTLNINGTLRTFDKPQIMGILNLTPDSFFDGGKYIDNCDAIRSRIDKMLADGANIVDLGAYSTRPGADDVSEDEEWRRLEPALKILSNHYPNTIVSVDTFRARVAQQCVESGVVGIINDISAGTLDANMFATVAQLHVPYILMHIQGHPKNMQNAPTYDDVTTEVIKFLSEKVLELHRLGVADIIIDPGFGFGKTVQHNYTLLKNLNNLTIFDMPILVGISRKSMIYKLLGTTPQESLNGTSILNTISLMNGASILRVHDVKEAAECVKIVEQLA
ncbi:MAG: dihydropteroate synthase [Bacteroidales bacterium]|nr:dihydropteroate synthase [Bacteroidales bacterium]